MLSELAPVCTKLLRLIENQRASGLYSLLLSVSHLMDSGESLVATSNERMSSSESLTGQLMSKKQYCGSRDEKERARSLGEYVGLDFGHIYF